MKTKPAALALAAVVSLAASALGILFGGGLGGFVLLVLLNGFSERQATPVLIGYALLVFGAMLLFSFGLSWLTVRQVFKEKAPRWWALLLVAFASALASMGCGILALLLKDWRPF